MSYTTVDQKQKTMKPSADPGGCFGGCRNPGYESQKKKKERERERKERKKERRKQKRQRMVHYK